MILNVPFVANSPDNTHCVQASYKMILSYFAPGQEYSMAQLEQITGKPEKGGAWAATGHMWLVDNGYAVEYLTMIDWPRFVVAGYSYLVEQFGPQVAAIQARNGDIKLEQQRAAAALKKVHTVRREPATEDIMRFLDAGYLVRCLVNARLLNGIPGYEAHSVVVIGYEQGTLIVHDPGLPPVPNRRVPIREFEAAWAWPKASAKELIAIKPVERPARTQLQQVPVTQTPGR